MEQLPDWMIFLGNFGFPTLVAVYLLVRFEKRIDGLTHAIQDLQASNNHKGEE
ncbi:YvrJ family protein [Salicibibacter cibarius]|uniref:YvrJ family protein n=1 Tax=Salicibibacter cibarius TaxID=2743000 RepID=A0A7T6Z6W5_9BACI|nr:YvrJ family protein [Salicibibacter cibarius]QQK77932.1 YvrJ family protein [Salicibibacter cibarius]